MAGWFSLRWLVVLSSLLLVQPAAPSAQHSDMTPLQSEALPANTVVETVVPNAGGLVVAMVFTPDGRMFYTVKGGFSGDRTAQVRIVDRNGTLRTTPFLSTSVNTDGERGLLGIALDPDFATNRYVYIFKTATASETGSGRPSNRVVRYTEDPKTQTAVAGSAKILLDVSIEPENDPNTNHNGGNLHFGPDGKLYVTIGDYGRHPDNAQKLINHLGKIHRLNKDGSIPSDNPFYSSPAGAVKSIWTYGNRNSFDFVFDPVTKRMFFTENGPGCDDEVNLAQRGGNYGWPNECGVVPSGTIAPLYRYSQPIGITGIDVYQGPIAQWHNSLFWCANNNQLLYRAVLDSTRTRITSVRSVDRAPECQVDVQHGPDGALYLSSGATIARVHLPFRPTNFVFLPVVAR